MKPATLAVWFGWLLLAAILSANNFRWEVEYFRSPGPVFFVVLLCALPAFFVACAVYVRIRRKRLWQWELPSLLVFAFLFAILYQPVAALISALLYIACASTGLRVTRLFRITLDTELEILTLGFGFGSALLIPLLFIIGLAHLYYPAVFLLILVLPVAVFYREVVTLAVALRRLLTTAHPSLQHPLAGIAFLFLVLSALAGLGVALSPSLAFDPLAMHIPSAAYYATGHALRPLPTLSYSYYPQSGEILMALGYSFAGQPGAELISPLFWIVFLLLLLAIARQCEFEAPAALVGLAAVALIPFAHWSGSNAKNDSLMVFFEAAALYAFIRWNAQRVPGWIVAGALFIASAFSIKHVALFGCVPLLCFFAFALFRSPRRIRLAVVFCLVLGVFGLYWHTRTFLLTGNPVYPAGLGQSVEHVGTHWPGGFMGHVSRFWQIPFRAQFDGTHAFESPLLNPVGIAFLVFLPVAFLIPRRRFTARRICLLFAAGYLLYWILIISQVRYAILPISLLTFFLLAKAVDFYNQAGNRAVRISLLCALTGTFLFGILGIAIIEVNAPELLLFAHRIDTQTYLRRALHTYGSLEWLNQNHIQSTVAAVGNCSRAYAPDPATYHCVFDPHRRLEGAEYDLLPVTLQPPPNSTETYRDRFFVIYHLPPQTVK